MYLREQYLRQIRPFYRNEQIKMLTGVRRAGKTELLKMIQRELLSETDRKHILYLSFELLENRKYRDASRSMSICRLASLTRRCSTSSSTKSNSSRTGRRSSIP